jgi:hypothetical protein
LSPLVPLTAGVLFVTGPLAQFATFRCTGSHALFSWGERFQGLTSDPLQFFVNACVALAFVWVLACTGRRCNFDLRRRPHLLRPVDAGKSGRRCDRSEPGRWRVGARIVPAARMVALRSERGVGDRFGPGGMDLSSAGRTTDGHRSFPRGGSPRARDAVASIGRRRCAHPPRHGATSGRPLRDRRRVGPPAGLRATAGDGAGFTRRRGAAAVS